MNSLDIKMRAKMIGLLELLEEKGIQLREPYSKIIEDGIFEIRCKVGNNISRVLYFFHFEGKIILENFKSKFHRPLMRWNLLLHEWSLIFHIFVLCS